MRSCFLFGHSDCPDTIFPELMKIIERFYLEKDMRIFYVGNRGSFDSLAAAAVKALKRKHDGISLMLLLAYHPGERPVELAEGFDGSYYPPMEKVPRRYAIVKANQYMAEHSDGIICYVQHIGNTRKLLDYAKKKGTGHIENIGRKR